MMARNADDSVYIIHGKTLIRVGWHLPRWQNLRDLHKNQDSVYLLFLKDSIEDKNLLNAIILAEAGDKASIRSLNNWMFSIGEKAGKKIAFGLIENEDNIEQEVEYIKTIVDNGKFTPLKYIKELE